MAASDDRSGHPTDQNISFFSGNSTYASRVAGLTTYRNIRSVIDRELVGVTRLIDIGNGGVFDYDTQLPEEIVGIDLFIDESVVSTLPPHVTLREGNALALPEEDGAYDCALFALVLHHLVEESPGRIEDNARTALTEARRVLRPGGKLVLVESCIYDWFYPFERALFRPLVTLTKTPLMSHPPALQMPTKVLRAIVSDVFGEVSVEPVPVGRVLLQFGHRWPSVLSPARPWLFSACKPH